MTLIALIAALSFPGEGPDRLVVHEWGTFTVLQDETGRALPGVNVNEESLPPFVHRLGWGLVPDTHRFTAVVGAQPYGLASKGIPRSFPAVVMRMETPIIYFHLPPGRKELTLDVEVKFRRGWISEWYPDAAVDAPGYKLKNRKIGRIGADTVGSVRWDNLTVRSARGDEKLPETDAHVWLAPRNVRSAIVTTAKGQTERYLFYRGVADLPAPVKVVRSKDGKTLSVKTRAPIAGAFLVDIRKDGLSWRSLNRLDVPTPAELGPGDEEGLSGLWVAMRRFMTGGGLYDDEADAMLNTWKASYFTSPGLRLFFVLPRTWTDGVLPLTISESADVERVMIGRVEIVTPAQRALLDQIAKGPASDRTWFTRAINKLPAAERNRIYRDFFAGRRSLGSLDLSIPADYRAYVDLGRFRDALVLDAARDGSRPALRQFARNYGLEYFH